MPLTSKLQPQTSPALPCGMTTQPPTVDFASAPSEARRILADQKILAQAMLAADDPKHWYVQLCQLTTEELLNQLASAQVPDPSWALRLLSLQHDRFLYNLRRWLSPNLGAAEPHWQAAFAALDLAGEASSVCAILSGLHLALRAQLEYDLPQTVDRMLRCEKVEDYAHLRANIEATALALRTAVERMLATAAHQHLPRWFPRSYTRLVGESLEFLIRRGMYDVVNQGIQAFERGLKRADRPVCSAEAKVSSTWQQQSACEIAQHSEPSAA